VRWVRPLLTAGLGTRAGEAPTDRLLRSHVLVSLGHYGRRAVIKEAQARFAAFLKDQRTLPADLRVPVLMIGAYGDRATYEQLHDLARGAREPRSGNFITGRWPGPLDRTGTLTLSIALRTRVRGDGVLVAAVAGLGEHQEQAWILRGVNAGLLGQWNRSAQTRMSGNQGSYFGTGVGPDDWRLCEGQHGRCDDEARENRGRPSVRRRQGAGTADD